MQPLLPSLLASWMNFTLLWLKLLPVTMQRHCFASKTCFWTCSARRLVSVQPFTLTSRYVRNSGAGHVINLTLGGLDLLSNAPPGSVRVSHCLRSQRESVHVKSSSNPGLDTLHVLTDWHSHVAAGCDPVQHHLHFQWASA